MKTGWGLGLGLCALCFDFGSESGKYASASVYALHTPPNQQQDTGGHLQNTTNNNSTHQARQSLNEIGNVLCVTYGRRGGDAMVSTVSG